ncbi:hypothetical protein BAC1_01736 [uncultured bacterium]|nr:hypothetical protein BAC1_01736 [uncultured bacterium]
MDSSEIKDIAEGLKRRIELLLDAGITAVPKRAAGKGGPAQGCAPGWLFFEGRLSEVAAFSPCVHQGWKGVLFGIYPLAKATALWGVPVSAESIQGNPFGTDAAAQLEKMLEWLAKELNVAAPDVFDPPVVIGASCPESGAYSDAGAATGCLKPLEPRISGVLLLMGELASWAFLHSADMSEARGRVHKTSGRKAVATYAPDKLVADQNIKKAAHADLKLLIQAIGS